MKMLLPDRKREPRGLPEFTWHRLRARLVVLVSIVLVVVGAWQTGVSPAALLESREQIVGLLERMWPPSFVEWDRYVWATIDTVLMVVAGTALAVALSIPLAAFAARNTTTGPIAMGTSRAIFAMSRAIPDIVFALILVRAVGIGPLAGILAIGLNSVGMVGKFFADQLEDVDPGPVEAVEATGAGRVRVFVSGVLPQVLAGWTSLSLYRVDINIRSAVILGYVGAGGIGLELQRVQGQLAYPRVLAIVVIVLALILGVEAVSTTLRRTLVGVDTGENPFGVRARLRAWMGKSRRKPQPPTTARRRTTAPWTASRVKLAVFSACIASLVALSLVRVDATPERLLMGLERLGVLMAAGMPPDFLSAWDRIVEQVIETFWIAITASGLGFVIAFPIAVLAALNTGVPKWIARCSRGLMLLVRGIPELILAVLFVVAVGLGPLAGVLALTVGSIGFTAKLLADALESMPLRDINEGLGSTGASWMQRLFAGIIPRATPAFIGVGLFTLDAYIRAATILGIVGAGGIGQLLSSSVAQRMWDRTFAIIIVIFVVVFAVERLSNWIRAVVVD